MVFCEHGESPIYDVVVGGQTVVEARRHRSEAVALRDYQAALAALRD
jgi:formimidoylglutamate deiminase